jgi:hypothetical protein
LARNHERLPAALGGPHFLVLAVLVSSAAAWGLDAAKVHRARKVSPLFRSRLKPLLQR